MSALSLELHGGMCCTTLRLVVDHRAEGLNLGTVRSTCLVLKNFTGYVTTGGPYLLAFVL